MATDKTSVKLFPHIFEQDTVADTWTEIILPSQCTAVKIFSNVHQAHIGVNSCTDAGAVDEACAFDIPANEIHEFKLGKGNSRPSSIFVSTHGGDSSVKVMLVE